MLQPRIEVKHLSKVFYRHFGDTFRENRFEKKQLLPDDKLVLDNVSFVFNSGETIGVIGRNGAGKSTLLSILAGVSKQTYGEVNICGKVTAVMTLGVGLREDLSGRDNIYLDGQLQGKTRNDVNKIIDEIIEFTELGEFIDRPVKVYSTGMKSRLAFSMLVGIEPEILIIDEALSAGDAFFAEKASQKIKEICKKGKIVIIVSHSMATIHSMCNRCLWVEKGMILMDDEPAKVTTRYLQKIQEEDQCRELKNHQAIISHTNEHANYKILDVALKCLDSDYPQSIFYTKDSLSIEIGIKKLSSGFAVLHFVLERIDGLVVCHEQHEINPDSSDLSFSFRIQFSLESLTLNKGYYQLKVDLMENSELTNQFIRFFEVKNNHMAKGGTSLLHYPAEIALLNEEVKLCSDSIELIAE